MNRDDFRHMRRGKQLAELSDTDLAFLKPVNRHSKDKNRALLMLHGFSSSPAVYRYMIPELTQYDAIFCPVLPGHAQSIDVFSQVTAKDWLACAEKACAELLQSYSQVDVMGLSLGGVLACHLSQKFPLRHLYLLAPGLALHLRINLYLKITRVCTWLRFSQIRNAAGTFLNEQHTEIAYRRLPIPIVTEVLSLINQFNWIPPACPVDVFLGCHDPVVASQKVSDLFAKLPNATIHWLKNSAHVLPLDNDVQEIINCINNKH